MSFGPHDSLWPAGLSVGELQRLIESDAGFPDDRSSPSDLPPRTLPASPPAHILELLQEAHGHLTARTLCTLAEWYPMDNVQIALRDWYKDESVRTAVHPARPSTAGAGAGAGGCIKCMACGPVAHGQVCVLIRSAINRFEHINMCIGLPPQGPPFTHELAVVLAGVYARDGFHCSMRSLRQLQRCCPGMDVAMVLQRHFVCMQSQMTGPPSDCLQPARPDFCVLCGPEVRNLHCVHAARTAM